ncbi:NAD(P)/FAD-dependent oxidoreductase [Sphingomonas prati]|uniref:D-arginine dehydrogenase n=1 Tax=Sphingomonas prati TaxID=1843237 RepID=A0A7W9BSE0_9SPHN|nr:FAD-dependent oxidoreductase [Sphingomonas prati]MBB5729276.1 D-arginine dehydrogenase [Sphingomonas prati]GGE78688.1 glycerol-3-phosphate dehydrogenase [Sphingomonas prati]
MIHDVAIVGAGIAGASLASELVGAGRIVLIEAESQPGYHATGRSAAFWTESYGGPAVQPLTTASHDWLAAGGFLTLRGAVHLAGPGDVGLLDAMLATFGDRVGLDRLDRDALEGLIPGLRAGHDRALLEASTCDIDVAALHADYLARGRRGGVDLLCHAQIVAAARRGGVWDIALADGRRVAARVLVNAAGAWAGAVAALAGASPIAIAPLRRTMVQLAVSPAPAPTLPLVIDIAGRFYLKPDVGGRLWLSPHDETPTPAGDVAADELDVAVAIDRLEWAVDWTVVARERAWAGLRSFAPDRAPVYGFDARAPGFFWFAAQGGFGIQTAPAAAMVGAALLTGGVLPGAVAGVDAERYAPGRFG